MGKKRRRTRSRSRSRSRSLSFESKPEKQLSSPLKNENKHEKVKTKSSAESSNASARPTRQKRMHTETRCNLPVYKQKQEICHLFLENEVILVVAETGSGKSTQIPAFLHESGCLNKILPSKSTGSMKQTESNHDNQNYTFKCNPKLARSICVTQPRRVAAMTVAKRVAEEMGCIPGSVVGHRVRFDDCTDINGPNTTRIIYATDGMLLREATSDPLLSRYGVVILDEAHERSLQTDVLFGIVKRAMKARNAYFNEQKYKRDAHGNHTNHENKKENNTMYENEIDAKIMKRMKDRVCKIGLTSLRVVVMSATLDVETFQSFFPHAAMIKIPGRQYPVQTLYTREPEEDYIDAALNTVLQIIKEGEDGDLLVFLPGQEEIESLASLLRSHLDEEAELSRSLSNNSKSTNNADIVQTLKGIGKDINASLTSIVNNIQICLLYAALPAEIQMFAFQPKPEGCTRKVVLATNIAETSVTLNGIRYVVDCGKHKTRDFDGTTGMESLTVADISKAQAAQRAGRAGRVSSGFCFRLYCEEDFNELNEITTPEILRVNLAHVVLQLKLCGIHDPRVFDFLTPPNLTSLKKAFELLYALKAVDDEMSLTVHGKKMAKLPLDPTFAHLLLQSPHFGCISEMLTVVAMLSAENIFYRPGTGGSATSSGVNSSGMANKAAAAHRRFASYEGDIPTLLSIYETWRNEAVYIPSYAGGKKAQKKKQKNAGTKDFGKMLHGEWCMKNYINGRALVRAHDVRKQLSEICGRAVNKNGLGWDIGMSCGSEMEQFFKCVCAGLFLQAAVRVATMGNVKSQRKNRQQLLEEGSYASGRYKALKCKKEVNIHPTSTLFGRNPAPKCIVFCELLQTKKAYIRGVTQVRQEWLMELVPDFYKSGG